jgi:uncharacterized protein (DUF983 family)
MFLIHKTAIHCPVCGTQLVIKQARTVIAGVVILIGSGVALGLKVGAIQATWPASLQLVAPVAFLLPPVFLYVWLAPRLLRVRPLRQGENAEFPLRNPQSAGA